MDSASVNRASALASVVVANTGSTTGSTAGSSLDAAQLDALRKAVSEAVVGREREQRLVIAALAAGRDLLLEGPPGTSKTTLLRSITTAFGVPLVFVEGNDDLTTAKLVGHHDPSLVLSQGFSEHTFVEGPLVRAMRTGGFLYVEEVNRAPEDTLNALLTAIAEREITVPRMGVVHALPGFRVVASMNPFDNVGTSRISTSVYDRLCRVTLGYQSSVEEASIVSRRTSVSDRKTIDDAVALTRLTRMHPLIRQGSSVRGAIDLVLVAQQLFAMNEAKASGCSEGRPLASNSVGSAESAGNVDENDQVENGYAETIYAETIYAETMRDALHVALSGRIRLDEMSGTTPEAVLDDLWNQHFVLSRHVAAPG
jgi:MoxR-like ATPase